MVIEPYAVVVMPDDIARVGPCALIATTVSEVSSGVDLTCGPNLITSPVLISTSQAPSSQAARFVPSAGTAGAELVGDGGADEVDSTAGAEDDGGGAAAFPPPHPAASRTTPTSAADFPRMIFPSSSRGHMVGSRTWDRSRPIGPTLTRMRNWLERRRQRLLDRAHAERVANTIRNNPPLNHPWESWARRLAVLGPNVLAEGMREEVERIGEDLDHAGGMPLMVEVAERANAICVAGGRDPILRHIEHVWHGIGRWQH